MGDLKYWKSEKLLSERKTCPGFGFGSVFGQSELLSPLTLPHSVSREADPKFGAGSVSGIYRDSIKENLLRFFSLLVSSTSGSTDS